MKKTRFILFIFLIAIFCTPVISFSQGVGINSTGGAPDGNGTGFYYWNGTIWLPIGMTSNSGGPCQVSMITNELDGTGVPCGASACGVAMSIFSCSSFCASSTYNGYSEWRMPSLAKEEPEE